MESPSTATSWSTSRSSADFSPPYYSPSLESALVSAWYRYIFPSVLQSLDCLRRAPRF